MMEPDFPITPPMRDTWQRMRKDTWPGGTAREEDGGGGFLERLEDPFAECGLGSGNPGDA